MPLPKPNEDEDHDHWITRCMSSSVMEQEYEDTDQRYAVCESQWERRKKMNLETKTFKPKDLKFDDEKGTFRAVFATLNVIDKDGDITLPGAFGRQRVPIGAYAHASWWGSDIPVGKGHIYEEGDDAIVEGQFFIDTTGGKDTYLMVKQMGDLQEWSYALPEIDYEYREEDGRRIRVLKKIKVAEVSPCLLGSGINTRTLDVKGERPKGTRLLDHLKEVFSDVEEVVDRLKKVKEMREVQGKDISKITIEQMNVLVDVLSEATKELKRLQEAKPDEAGLQKEFLIFQKILLDKE